MPNLSFKYNATTNIKNKKRHSKNNVTKERQNVSSIQKSK